MLRPFEACRRKHENGCVYIRRAVRRLRGAAGVGVEAGDGDVFLRAASMLPLSLPPCLSIYLSLSIYIYMHIYIYIERERETSLRTFCPAEKRQASSSGLAFVCTSGSDAKRFGEGPLGSALMGSLQISCLLTEGLPGYSRQPNCVFPKVPGRTPFSPNLSKCITFAAAPLMATPFVRHQRM